MTVQKYPYDPDQTTVKVAEDWVIDNAGEGAECPCCGQLAKVYRRKLYSVMAYALICIYKEPEEWIHVPSLLNGKGSVARGGDFAKLVHWGLIEASSKSAGYYRITQKGRDFVQCRTVVPSAMFIYNGEALQPDDEEHVSISEALGTAFKYDTLMEAV